MPIVNYVREHTRFMEYAADEHLSSSERLVWYALMHIFNQRAQGNIWPDEFIRINNDRLLSYCPIKFDTLAAARNKLKQRGLIELIPGEKNKLSPAYRMIYFYPQYAAPETERDGECYPKNSDYMGDKVGGNMGDNIGGKPGDYMGDIYINQKGIRYQNPLDLDEEEQDEEDQLARAREEVVSAWVENFGKRPAPAIADNLAVKARMLGFRSGTGIIRLAVRTAALKSAESPESYISTLLKDWHCYKIQDENDLCKYQILRRVQEGRDWSMSTDEANKQLEEMREREIAQ